VLLSVGLFAADSLWRWPNYLAYFNQIVGGPRYGYRHLVDSSLDWGQELPALKQWIVKEGLDGSSTEKTYLSYFGQASPRFYDIRATHLACFYERPPAQLPSSLEPGTYCISATMLQRVWTSFPSKWNRENETAYQQLGANVRIFAEADAGKRQQLIAQTGQNFWPQVFLLFEQARLARLAMLLLQREPDDEINHSILIYKLNAADLDRALNGPPIEIDNAPAAGH
jgi:hypothetical protein